MELYTSPIGLTSQFRFCGNAFRLDSYRGCNNGCTYCFLHNANCNSNRIVGMDNSNIKVADIKLLQRLFKNAFETDKEFQNVDIELLRHKVPLHLGGLSDPFQDCEKEYGITKEILKLSNKYNYPVIISTKGKYIDDEHFELLNPELHAIQISLFSNNQKSIEKLENNTPSAKDRIKLIKRLKQRGHWVSVRIQPLIYLNEALSLIDEVQDYIDFLTVEHLKIPADNQEKLKYLIELIRLDFSEFKRQGREYELKTHIKENNIKAIKQVIKVPLGIGDNDLMHLSDTNNCCGIDTMNKNFDNWLKHNSMTIQKTKDTSNWCPCKNINCYPYIKKTGTCYKEYVDSYLNLKGINPDIEQINLFTT